MVREALTIFFVLFTPPLATGQRLQPWSPALLTLVFFQKYCYLLKKLEFYKSPNAYVRGWHSGVDTTTQLFKHRLWPRNKKNTNIRGKKQINILYPATTAETNQTVSPLVKPQGFTPAALKQ